MIKEIHQACGELNEKLGLSVSLPTPKRKALKAASVCNFVVGAGLLAAGAAFSSKWCAVLGGTGIISSAVLRRESRKR